MPHPDLGRVCYILGGGGPAEGLPQITQINQFKKAGIEPDIIVCKSVGTLNALDLDNALTAWKEKFYSPWAIYNLNPEIEAAIDKALRAVPKSPFHKHDTWHDLWRDFETQYHNIKQILSLVFRIINSIPSLPGDINSSPKNFSPVLETLVKELQNSGLDKVKNILDPTPLVNTLKEILNLKKVLEGDTSLLILACSGIEEHIFAAGKKLSAEALSRIKMPIHEIITEEQLFSAAMASSALRPYFAPVNIDGTYYYDTGTQTPFPVQVAIDAGCDTIFAFIKDYRAFHLDLGANILDAFMEENDKLTRKIYINTYKEIFSRKDIREKIYLVLPQTLHPDLQLWWNTHEATEYTIKNETEATRKWLKENLPAQAGLNIDAKD